MVSFRADMAKKRTRLVIAIAIAIAALLTGINFQRASAAEPSALVRNWLFAQTNIHTWSADFLQTRMLKSLTQPLTATGRVWFAEPTRFRWELGNPPKTIALRATNDMLVIYPRLKRVERYQLNNAGEWRDALALLETGFLRTESEMRSRFNLLSEIIIGDSCELTLQPKAAGARRMMPQIKLAFSTNDFALRATELQFADGSTMRNDFTNSVVNPNLEPILFAPNLGSDYQIVDPLKK